METWTRRRVLQTALAAMAAPRASRSQSPTPRPSSAEMILGAMYREDLCLDAAQAVEDRLGIFTPIDPFPETGRSR